MIISLYLQGTKCQRIHLASYICESAFPLYIKAFFDSKFYIQQLTWQLFKRHTHLSSMQFTHIPPQTTQYNSTSSQNRGSSFSSLWQFLNKTRDTADTQRHAPPLMVGFSRCYHDMLFIQWPHCSSSSMLYLPVTDLQSLSTYWILHLKVWDQCKMLKSDHIWI